MYSISSYNKNKYFHWQESNTSFQHTKKNHQIWMNRMTILIKLKDLI